MAQEYRETDAQDSQADASTTSDWSVRTERSMPTTGAFTPAPFTQGVRGFARGVLPPQGLEAFVDDVRNTFRSVFDMYGRLIGFQTQEITRAIEDFQAYTQRQEMVKPDSSSTPSDPASTER
ncbi:MAG: hypothetical protein HC837_10420 [Chloroflexaceae bacterium]|nr:hypothetical protein [Chloroflexaceae bacterium]